MSEPDEDRKPDPVPLTVASLQALARNAGLEPAAAKILESHAYLENGLAALLDNNHFDSAFRLVARMLTPAKAMLWVLLGHDILIAGGRGETPAELAARQAMLDFARKPGPDTMARFEKASQSVGGTHPFGLAASALNTVNDPFLRPSGGDVPFAPGLFSDLIGRAVWLISLSVPGDDRAKAVIAKELASRGVSLALS